MRQRCTSLKADAKAYALCQQPRFAIVFNGLHGDCVSAESVGACSRSSGAVIIHSEKNSGSVELRDKTRGENSGVFMYQTCMSVLCEQPFPQSSQKFSLPIKTQALNPARKASATKAVEIMSCECRLASAIGISMGGVRR